MRLLFDAVLLASVLALSHALLRTIGQRSAGLGGLQMLLAHWPMFVAALSLYGFVFVYYTVALRQHKLALLYPLYTGLSMLLVLAVGVLCFGETLTLAQRAGCGLMLLAILLLSI